MGKCTKVKYDKSKAGIIDTYNNKMVLKVYNHEAAICPLCNKPNAMHPMTIQIADTGKYQSGRMCEFCEFIISEVGKKEDYTVIIDENNIITENTGTYSANVMKKP